MIDVEVSDLDFSHGFEKLRKAKEVHIESTLVCSYSFVFRLLAYRLLGKSVLDLACHPP